MLDEEEVVLSFIRALKASSSSSQFHTHQAPAVNVAGGGVGGVRAGGVFKPPVGGGGAAPHMVGPMGALPPPGVMAYPPGAVAGMVGGYGRPPPVAGLPVIGLPLRR
jgi:hypothetical protein